MGGATITATNERVIVKGRSRVVYIGPKGGRYIKTMGKFVRLTRLSS